ncbi:FAD-binding oxidoreductase [Kitasatospora sp. LaBMicrA B282]|uniref:FAD-binding oxidoreductase n=1 Tax=Kitasatospora sp. LaBMicrA B282 TaxID=3420949 RepID=UPI003D0A720C
MNHVSRRRFLSVSAAGGAAVSLAAAGAGPALADGSTGSSGSAAAGATTSTSTSTSSGLFGCPPAGAVTVTPTDPRYGYLTARGANRRFTSTAATIHQVFTPQQVVAAVAQEVAAGRQIAVRSGGHCLDALVDVPAVQSVIDVSQMKDVYFDPTHQAFAVESGAMLQDVYKQLLLGWGVVVPGGTCPTVGIGGYVQGGGFGSMTRQYGFCVDHLYGVEVVTVDAANNVQLVVATNDPADPNQDLWWAHTGAGGGNYGVVTRYLFRSPNATGTDPGTLLPAPPATNLVTTVAWPWSGLTQNDFVTLVTNYGTWMAANSADGSPYASMFSALILEQASAGACAMVCEIDGTLPNAADLMSSFVAAVNAGVSAPSKVTQVPMPWLDAQLAGLYGGSAGALNRNKGKGAYLRSPYTAAQATTLYTYLSSDTYSGLGALALFSFGCRANTVAPSATANPHRDSIMLSYLATYWSDPTQDDQHIAWLRAFYTELYGTTGGVPAPGTGTDGSYINYPDVDLADPAQNTSGIPWSTIYFKDNYARLQAIKQRYDPQNLFRHPLSVQLPG